VGNRRLYKVERFHTPDMSESKQLKVTALNLFHPTASPFSEKSVFSYCETVSKGEGKDEGVNLKPAISNLQFLIDQPISYSVTTDEDREDFKLLHGKIENYPTR